MKKTLLLFAMLLGVLGTWAQTPVLTYTNITAPQELSAKDAETIREMDAMTIVAEVDITNADPMSLLFAAVADITSSNTDNNAIWGVGVGGKSLRYVVGPREGGWYSSSGGTLTTATKKIAFTYNGSIIRYFKEEGHVKDQGSTKSLSTFDGQNAKFYLGGMIFNTNTKWGTFNGTIHSVRIYNKAMTADEIAALPKCVVREIADLENGKLYNFVTQRGWLGAKSDNEKVISTVYTSNGVTGSKTDPYFQWTVYKSVNNRYYLYNIGKEKFIGNQDANNQAIPFVTAPTTMKLAFKKSSTPKYPIMFSTNNKGVVNHSGNHNPGIVNWTGGWSKLDDPGSNHLVENVGELDDETLAKIESAVLNYEWNEFEGPLRTTYEKLYIIDSNKHVGTSVGQWNWNEDDWNTLAEISDFMEHFPTDKTFDNLSLIEEKLSEAENLFNKLNKPEPGKFYRFKGKVSECYISANVNNNSKMTLVGDKEADPTATVFYLTENYKLLSFKYGTFLKETYRIDAFGENNGNTISFNLSESGMYGFFTLKTNYNSPYIYDDKNDGEVDRNSAYAADNCEWTIEEVTYLPVPVSNTLKWGTLYSPVALSLTEKGSKGKIKAYTGIVNGKTLKLTEITGDLPSNTPVVIEHIGGDYKNGCAFLQIIEDVDPILVDNNLEGTLADTYITPEANETAYVLANKDDKVGFYKAEINVNTDTSNDLTEGEGDNATTTPVPESFLNNGFKAYLPVTNAADARFLVFSFGDGEETGITETENGNVETEVYDLSGRRVQNAKKGIFVINGKVVVK